MAKERLQKFLAAHGYGSRRQIERWIEEERIRINNRVARLGDKVDENDRISLNGKPLKTDVDRPRHRYIIMNKPLGYVCTRKDEKNRKNVFDLLPRLHHQRWINIGRLDINSSGLLLFTTDGELVNRLTHPSFEIDREYMVRVKGRLDEKQMQALLQGVMLDDGMARFEDILLHREQGANTWYHVVLREGRYREVRRLFATQGLEVNRLIRTRFGLIYMKQKLKPGEFTELSKQETGQLYQMAKMDRPARNS